MTIDAIGRDVGEIKDIAKQMLDEVKKLEPFQKKTDDTRDDQYKQIIKLLTNIDKNIGADMGAASAAATRNMAAVKGGAVVKKGTKYGTTSFTKDLNLFGSNIAAIIKKMGAKIKPAAQGTVGMAATGNLPAIIYGTKHPKGPKGAAGGGGGSGGGGGTSAAGMGAGFLGGGATAVKAAYKIQEVTHKLGIDLMDVFSFVLADSAMFVRNMRMVSYTTRDWGENTQKIADQWLDIGLQQQETGYSNSTYQKILQKESQKGFTSELKFNDKKAKYQKRSIKDQIEMTKTSMHTAFMIGSNVEETADVFSEWQQLKVK